MKVEVAVTKASKWAARESGDTLEMVERPHGGISFVLVDGQRSGRAAKAISNLVARKAISELAEGVRDGAAARAAHDYLYTHRSGQVSATLNIASVDMSSNTLVLSRNSQCPIVLVTPERTIDVLDDPSVQLGVHRGTKPQITEVPLEPKLAAIVYTDGLKMAGARSGPVYDIPETVRSLIEEDVPSATELAEALLQRALALEEDRPRDDISILALCITEKDEDDVRRLTVSLPL